MEPGNVTPGLMTAKQQKYPERHPEKSKFLDSAVSEEQLMMHNCGLRSIWKMQICNDNHIFARMIQKGKAGFRSYSSLNQRMRSSAAHQERNHRGELTLCQTGLILSEWSGLVQRGDAGWVGASGDSISNSEEVHPWVASGRSRSILMPVKDLSKGRYYSARLRSTLIQINVAFVKNTRH